jgi:hypothetical protein
MDAISAAWRPGVEAGAGRRASGGGDERSFGAARERLRLGEFRARGVDRRERAVALLLKLLDLRDHLLGRGG